MKNVSRNIRLERVGDVKNFIEIVDKYDFAVTLSQGEYVVDAKSIMGIFSLNLDDPLTVKAEIEGDEKIQEFLNDIEKYIDK